MTPTRSDALVYRPDALPAQFIVSRAGPLRWLVDADAAADLESRGKDR